MMSGCAAIPPDAGFIGSVSGYIDCQADILGSGAWQALAAPGSTLSIVLTGFLTIFIALIGYNLLLGRSMTVRSGTLAIVKIGAVFALATSWPAYRTLVYDLVTDGPSQLVGEIGPAGGVVGSDGTLVQRLDMTDQALAQLALLGLGNPPPNAGVQVTPPPFIGFDSFAIGGARILFELTAVASLGVIRIITGVMLALGPFFIAFLMFENTRSLFEGWVRVLAGAALGAVGVAITLGLELALIEPWLSTVLAHRMAGEALPTIATELFVIATFFAVLVAGCLYGCSRVVGAFRLAPLLQGVSLVSDQRPIGVRGHATERAFGSPTINEAERTRAAAVASLLLATSRRERGAAAMLVPAIATPPGRTLVHTVTGETGQGPVPVGRSFTRRPNSRMSRSSSSRDARA